MKKYFYLAMAIGLSFIPALASAAPSLPMSLWGTATVNGSTNVPLGTVIRSYNASGVLYDSTTVTTAGLYGTDSLSLANPAEDRLLFEGSGGITFKAIIPGYASGVEVTATETETYAAGIAERKDLTFTAAANACNPSVVSNGTVGAYPDCVLTCASGYSKSGNSCIYSGGGGGGGGGASDVTAPVITSVVATSTGATTATVTWQTGESSLSWVVYGLTTAYGSQAKTSTYVTSHSVNLTGLTASTLYHFQVKSQDSSGNIGISTDRTFTTLAQGQGTTTTTTTTGTTGTTTGTSFSNMTRDQLLAYIIQLIASLQGGQTGTTGGTTTGGTGTTGGTTGQTGGTTTTGLSGIPSTFTFQTNLRFGMNLEDVKYLQMVLNSDPATRVAATGVGSSGKETTMFGNATLAAVKTFQTKYNIASSGSAGYGLVGPATRAKLNSLLGR